MHAWSPFNKDEIKSALHFILNPGDVTLRYLVKTQFGEFGKPHLRFMATSQYSLYHKLAVTM